ncbi:MAG: hypothetical protein ACP5O7_13280, partial [Phycisphaerae bacterium]
PGTLLLGLQITPIDASLMRNCRTPLRYTAVLKQTQPFLYRLMFIDRRSARTEICNTALAEKCNMAANAKFYNCRLTHIEV